jgi:uncharacterized membrane protein YkvA (DUF1232 family)
MNNKELFESSDSIFDDTIRNGEETDPLGIVPEYDTEQKIHFVEENLGTKLQRSGKKISFAKDILALFNYMKDPFVSWHRKAIVVAALIYFIVPIDAVPDISPLIGYLDDLGVIAALLKFLGSEILPYYKPEYRS